MLWQKRTGAGFLEGPGAPVDLRTILGLTGRLLFAEGAAGQRMTSLPCSVVKIDRTGITLELSSQQGLPQPESAVILEVAKTTALVQCFTLILSRGPGNRVVVRIPGRPHILQRRRFPRIDLYIGVTIKTSERQIEPIPAQMINLSMDGAAFVLVEPISPGTVLEINLSAIGMHPADVAATSVRCVPTPSHLWLVGVQFNDLQGQQELYLSKYMAQLTESTNT